MSITIRKATAGDAFGIAETLVEAFYDSFKSLSKSKEKLAAAVMLGVQHDHFFIAYNEEAKEVVGTVAVSDESGYPVVSVPKALKDNFGSFRAFFAKKVMDDEFMRPKHFSPGQGYIGFVAVKEKARGQSLAKKMIRFVLDETDYASYALDVVEGNEVVLPIYQSLGFVETHREKESGAWMKGFHFRYILTYRESARESECESD